MKAALALLANTEVHNFVRQLAWTIHQKYHIGLETSRLPPHVSLKQPFAVSDLAALETYMRELADSITPVEVAAIATRSGHYRGFGYWNPLARCPRDSAATTASQPNLRPVGDALWQYASAL